MKPLTILAALLAIWLATSSHEADDLTANRPSTNSVRLVPSLSDVKIRVNNHWVTVDELLTKTSDEIKSLKPRYPIADVKPVVLFYPHDTNRIVVIRYDISDPARSDRVTSVPLIAEIAHDLTISIRETRLEKDLLQTAPLK